MNSPLNRSAQVGMGSGVEGRVPPAPGSCPDGPSASPSVLPDGDPSRWRQGRRVPRNLYRGNEPICMVATDEIAAEMVAALNGSPEMRALLEAERRIEDLTAERDYIETRRAYWQEQALREHERAEIAGVGWRPIETAPPGKTHVLVSRPDRPPVRAFRQGGVWWMHGDGPWRQGSTPLEGHFAPTHWMPLPAPPASGTDAHSAETRSGSVEDEGPARRETPHQSPDPLSQTVAPSTEEKE